MPLANCCRKLTRVRALAGIFLVMGMRATLQAATLAAALFLKGHALGSGGSGSALAVGFRNDLIAHGNLSSLVKTGYCSTFARFFLAKQDTDSGNPCDLCKRTVGGAQCL